MTGPARVSRASGIRALTISKASKSKGRFLYVVQAPKNSTAGGAEDGGGTSTDSEHRGVVAVAADRDPPDGRKVAEQVAPGPSPSTSTTEQAWYAWRAAGESAATFLHRIGLPRDVVRQRIVRDVDDGGRTGQPSYGQKGSRIEHEPELAKLRNIWPLAT